MARRLLLPAALLAVVSSRLCAEEGAPPETPPGEAAQDGEGTVVTSAGASQKARTLTPQDVPAEAARLASKADIKAELSLRTLSGRPITFRGVIRNGKLIERIVDRKFVPQRNLDEPDCGVRLWWANETEGYIFFKYSAIQTLTITGLFTKEDMRKLLEALEAKRKGQDAQPAVPASSEPDLEKLSPDELKAYLVARFPYDKGWNHDKKRELTRKKIIENQPLTPEEAIFEKYFAILAQARFEELQRSKEKVTIEPGSQPAQPVPGVEPAVPNPPPPAPPPAPPADDDDGGAPPPPSDEGGDEGGDEPAPPEEPEPTEEE